MRKLATLFAIACLSAFLVPAAARADEGWRITSARIDITVGRDGLLTFVEQFNVDFASLQKHGIFRDLQTRFRCEGGQRGNVVCPSGSDRLYPVKVLSVQQDGRPAKYDVLHPLDLTQLKIGDPNRTISGSHTYRIEYTVRGGLNPFTDHDELYWNVIGTWPVPIDQLTVQLHLPSGAAGSLQLACFQGRFGSREGCAAQSAADGATFAATRVLRPDEQMTIVAGWPKGIVQVQPSVIEHRQTPADFFTLDPIELGGAAVIGVALLAGIVAAWWRYGRDRRYRTMYYLTNDPGEQTAPLFADKRVVVEYTPPEGWRPAEMGVLLDERADTLDVTASIIDLAVRGYLGITEIPKKGWFGKSDWELKKLKAADDALRPFETTLLDSLFEGADTVRISSLKNKFYKDLAQVKRGLYDDALSHHWFRFNPERARWAWRVGGLLLAGAGVGVGYLAGLAFGRALLGLPIMLAGLLVAAFAGAMPRRTAAGSEALRRVLGFRLYIATAEKQRQEFAEKANIFATYLPYAIVFGCVEKWAKAFAAMGAEPQAAVPWYSGTGPFNALAFSAGMRDFSSSVSSAIASTPGGSGASGFGGGSSGGGGGGGGGGSW